MAGLGMSALRRASSDRVGPCYSGRAFNQGLAGYLISGSVDYTYRLSKIKYR